MARQPEEEELGVDEGGEAVVIAEESSAIANAPWWLISAGLHVVLLLAATLVVIEKLHPVEETEVLVRMNNPAPAPVVMEDNRPRDTFERKGLAKDDVASTPTDEPAIFFPEAKESDHNESADNEDYHQMKGDSKDFLSYIPGESGGFRGRQTGKAQGVYDTMGVGGGSGSGGRYGGRFGGRENLVARGGGTKATESAVTAALKWLARHQNPDGSWSCDGFSRQCTGAKCSGVGEKDYDVGVTGLCLLAFLGAGYSHLSKEEYPDPMNPGKTLKFGQVVKTAMKWITEHQDAEGCIGERGPKYMYNHTVAALSLTEAYGMSGTQILAGSAQKAIDFIAAAQNPGRAWRYTAKCGDNDSSVTGWAVMALKSAELSDLKISRACYEGALAWYEECTDKGGYYPVGYTHKGTGKVFVPNKNEQWDDHPAMSAVAVMARIFMQKNKREPSLGSVNLLINDLPEWKQNKIDFYYWYYASLALFQYDGPDGPMWKKWNEPMKNALVPNQKTSKDACQNGSWGCEEDRWGFEGGRVYATAINALTLEVYYRYASVFGVGGGKSGGGGEKPH